LDETVANVSQLWNYNLLKKTDTHTWGTYTHTREREKEIKGEQKSVNFLTRLGWTQKDLYRKKRKAGCEYRLSVRSGYVAEGCISQLG